MGSGLILLVIVAAWLAVLVPMALRSSDPADPVTPADRFSDAMRVLSRRDAAARARAVGGSPRLGQDEDEPDDVDDWPDEPLLTRVRSRLAALPARRRAPSTPAARRRRVLLLLVVLAAATLALGLVVTPVLLAAHAVADLALVLYAVQLRRLARRRTRGRAQRPAPRRRPAAGAGSVRVRPVVPEPVLEPVEEAEPADVPDLPVEPLAAELLPAPVRAPEPVPAGLGAPWSPVPVPPPLYARAPVAPRPARPVGLHRPAAQVAAERLPGMEDDVTEREVERRRAVNEW